ncbi:MAG: hypothetical protein KAH38_04475, partial [Candidatus Hydrogenedentes bacterium]|nr:hypothetical protein [Candidatus Hydrogenedentota bacterium]
GGTIMLQTDYRPQSFANFVGNEPIMKGLQEALAREDFPRVFLFTGMAGSGKTTGAFLLKNYFGCSDMDTMYYNSANTRGIDTIREITVNSQLSPINSKVRLYILDEIHGVSGAAAESLLLLLENPPARTIFALCTSEPDKIKLSIKRRCFQVNLKPLETKDIVTILNNILIAEEIDDMPKKVLLRIAEYCQGSAGMAVSLLDSVIDILDEEQQLIILDGMRGVTDTEGIDICRALMTRNWKTLQPLLTAYNGEAESMRYLVLSYFSKILLSKNTKNHPLALSIIELFGESWMYSRKAGLIASCYLACK